MVFGVMGIVFVVIALWMGCCSRSEGDSCCGGRDGVAFPALPGRRAPDALRDTKYMRADSDWDGSPTHMDAAGGIDGDDSGIELL